MNLGQIEEILNEMQDDILAEFEENNEAEEFMVGAAFATDILITTIVENLKDFAYVDLNTIE